MKAWRLRQITLEDFDRIRILETDLSVLEGNGFTRERKTTGVRKLSNFWNSLEQMKEHRIL